MTCEFQSPRDSVGFSCSINRYGGQPHALACQQCIKDGRNVAASKLPSAAEMATGLMRSAAAWGKSGFKLADEDKLTARLDACKACPEWDAAGMAGTGRCRKCGCSTQAKLRIDGEKCPLGRW